MLDLSPARHALLERLADRIAAADAIRVGVDGVDGAGKTIFADELAELLRTAGRDVVRVSIDGFHNPRAVRYRRGRTSPEGFWLDSYDYPRFHAEVIEPFSPGGDRRYRSAIRDVASDEVIETRPAVAREDALLIVDGIFLNRDELCGCWDFSVFLRAEFDETFRRMASRDGCPADPSAPENHRYLAGQQLYLAACDPESRADVVIDNGDPARARLEASAVGPP